jgi:hypothetical protein
LGSKLVDHLDVRIITKFNSIVIQIDKQTIDIWFDFIYQLIGQTECNCHRCLSILYHQTRQRIDDPMYPIHRIDKRQKAFNGHPNDILTIRDKKYLTFQ